MRTTVDIPDPTYRKLKSKAAAEGTSVKELILRSVEKGFKGRDSKRGRIKLPIVRSARPGSLRLTNQRVYESIPFP